jgi:hypothetical protein
MLAVFAVNWNVSYISVSSGFKRSLMFSIWDLFVDTLRNRQSSKVCTALAVNDESNRTWKVAAKS